MAIEITKNLTQVTISTAGVSGGSGTSGTSGFSINNGSFATTGSNQFNGNQSISGSITLQYGARISDNVNNALAFGLGAGIEQQNGAIAIGDTAGLSQGYQAIAIGNEAAGQGGFQGQEAIAIGLAAGGAEQGAYAIAIGTGAGQVSQSIWSVAIGYDAGRNSQTRQTIILNATGEVVDGIVGQSGSFYVAPIRKASGISGILQYDSASKEVTYSNSISGSISITGSLTISSSGTFTNIGPANFIGNQQITGSLNVSGSTTINGPLFLENGIIIATGSSEALAVYSQNISVFGIANANTFPNDMLGEDASIFIASRNNFPISNGPGAQMQVKSGSQVSAWYYNWDGTSYFPGDINIGFDAPLSDYLTSGSLNIRNGNINLSGSLNVSGSQTFIGNQTLSGSKTISGSLNVNGPIYKDGNKQFNYGQWASLQTQTGSANTAYAMKLEKPIDDLSGFYVGNDVSGFPTRIYSQNTGLYNIQFSTQLHTTSNQAVDFSIWFAMTGSSIANSNTDFSIEKVSGGGFQAGALNFLTPISSGSYVELYWSKTTANGQLQAKGIQSTPTRPATPSVIVTVTQVA